MKMKNRIKNIQENEISTNLFNILIYIRVYSFNKLKIINNNL